MLVTRRSLVAAAGTAVSRVTGFGRFAATAAVLGPTYLGNTFQAANTIPNYAYEMLAGSLFVPLLVPHLVRHVDRGDRRAQQRIAGSFLTLAVLLSLAAGILVVAAGPLILRALTLGVEDPTTAEAQRHAGWLLLALVMPQVSLYSVAAVGAAVMNSRNRFALAAAAPAFENIGIILTLVAYHRWFSHTTSLASAGTAPLLLLGAGATASVALHAGAQWFGAHRAGVTLTPRLHVGDDSVRRVLHIGLPSLGYAGLTTLLAFSWLVVANRVAGGVVAFQIAFQLFELPTALAARPVAAAALPQLARHHADRDSLAFRDDLLTAARLIVFVTIPAALAISVLAAPLARLLCYGAMSNPRGIGLVTACLAALGPGVVGYAGLSLTTQAAYASGEAGSALRSLWWGALGSVAIMAGTVVWAHGEAVMILLGVAVTCGFIVSAGLLGARLRIVDVRGISSHGLQGAVIRALRGSAVMLPPAYLVAAAAPPATARPLQVLLVPLGAMVGAAVFLTAERACRSPEFGLLWRAASARHR